MECSEARSRLHPYLDQELDLQSSLALEQHLGSCAACRAAFERQSALQSALRNNAAYYRAPASLADRIRRQVGAQQSEPRPQAAKSRWRPLPRWLPLGAAVAATALVTWTAALQYAGLSSDERLAEQVIDGHARSVLTSHLIDVASSDQHTVKPWLSSKLDFSPAVVDLAQEGFSLAGGRLDYLDNRPVAALVYRYRQHVIDLFVWPQAKPSDAARREVSLRGYNVVRWSEGGMSYWAVSDVNSAEMQKFAEAYSQAR